MKIKNLKKNDSLDGLKLIYTIYDSRKIKNKKDIEEKLKSDWKKVNKRVIFRKRIGKNIKYYCHKFGAGIDKGYLYK